MLVFTLFGAVFLAHPPADPDLFARMAVGKLITAYGGVPLADPFAFTLRKSAFVDHEWLAGYVYYWIGAHYGDFGLIAAAWVSAGAAIMLLLRACATWNGGRVSALSFLVATLQCAYIWTSVIRAQVFTYVCIAALLFALARLYRARSIVPLACMPALMVVWANAHGGFVAGLGLMGLAVVGFLLEGRRWEARALAVATVASVAATTLNPYGFARYWSFMLDAVAMRRQSIAEWAPLSLSNAGDVCNALYVMIIAVGMWMERKHLSMLSLLLFGAAAYEGIAHQRLAAIAAMTGGVCCQNYFDAAAGLVAARCSRTLRRAWSLVLAGGLVWSVCAAGLWIWRLPSLSLDYASYPVQAMRYLKESGRHGKLLVDFNRGSYALWNLYPDFTVSLDGRYEEVYPDETVRMVSQALDPSCTEFLASFETVNPDVVLVDAGRGSAFLGRLPAGWRLMYQDAQFELLSRD